MKYTIIAILITGIATIIGCQHGKGNNGLVKNISSTDDDESHNMGQNCMNCHKSGGDGEGKFVVAGTAYHKGNDNTNPNGFIELYTEPAGKGTLVKRLEVDGKGNFFTTENMLFGSGLYPVAIGANGSKEYMLSPTINGACNSCHGVSQDKIRVGN